MKITPLPSVENATNEIENMFKEDDEDFYAFTKAGIANINKIFTQRDELAYTSLIEGIEGLRWPVSKRDEGLALQEKIGHNEALDDIIEKVVKPLYGKE